MISSRSLKNYLLINGFILCISLLEYKTIHYIEGLYTQIQIQIACILCIFLSRNYLLVQYIANRIKDRENIHPKYAKIEDYTEGYPHEFLTNLVSSTIVETATYVCIKEVFYETGSIIYYQDLVFFIPCSFIFEVIFDFFHYWTHRILHTNKWLYIHIHKKHHKYSYPMPILTYYHSPLDLIITNSIPQMITLGMFPYISLFQFNLILTYKTFIEISGHSSKKMYPSGSFSQCIWIPRFLDISLYTEDHTLHHSNNNCNYSKRFSLWDKVFNTYTPLDI